MKAGIFILFLILEFLNDHIEQVAFIPRFLFLLTMKKIGFCKFHFTISTEMIMCYSSLHSTLVKRLFFLNIKAQLNSWVNSHLIWIAENYNWNVCLFDYILTFVLFVVCWKFHINIHVLIFCNFLFFLYLYLTLPSG